MLKINNNAETGKWSSPLPGLTWSMPLGKNHPSGFGSRRKYGFHTGIDLYCEHDQPLAAVESGKVISITDFGKRQHTSPWLNKTRVILIEGKSGIVAYCNVREDRGLKPGHRVDSGQVIGKVVNIFKKRNKKNACMLHLELYSPGTKRRVSWSNNYPKPQQLLDPTSKLLDIIVAKQVMYKRG